MKKDLLLLLDHALGFILGGVMTLLVMAALYLDIYLRNPAISERTATEAMQEGLLLIIILVYTYIAWKNKKMRLALVLVAGFFACMLLREMDYWFGLAGMHWLPPVIVTASACIFYAAVRLEKTIRGLACFAESKLFAGIMSGLLTVLIFSRLFGMNFIWSSLLGEAYPRWVKIFAEEGVELFGYAQCFLGTAFYALLEWRKTRVHSAEAPTLFVASDATARITS